MIQDLCSWKGQSEFYYPVDKEHISSTGIITESFLLKADNGNNRTRCEICLNLKMMAL